MKSPPTRFAPLVLSVAGFALSGLFGSLSFPGCARDTSEAGDGHPGPHKDVQGDADAHGSDWLGKDTGGNVVIFDIVVVENPANVLSFFVEWRTSVPAQSDLRVVCPGDIDVTLPGQSAGTEHRAFVMGLYAGARCSLGLTAVAAGGGADSKKVALAVGSLPDFLPALAVPTAISESIEPGWTLFNLTNSYKKLPLVVAMIDQEGRYRWYHRRAVNDAGSDNDTRATPAGILVGGSHGHIFPALIDYEGNIVWEKKVKMHHDLRPYGSEGHVLYLIDEWACGLKDPSGAVVEYDPATDKELWKWTLCEHYLPQFPTKDWSHLNAASLPPDNSYMLVSSRNQNALFRVSLTGGKILWKLGEKGDFALEDEDVFYQQHDPEIQPDGTILLFDNGTWGLREYSRALQLKLDEQKMTATRVWEYRHTPDIFSPIFGDADRLSNGNTLINFGQRDGIQQTRFIEVTPSGKKVWELAMPPTWSSYRVERVTTPLFGHRK